MNAPGWLEIQIERSMRSKVLPYDADGLAAFNAYVKMELDRWWTKRYLAHWVPRARLGLWMFLNLRIITKCIAEQERRLREKDGPTA